MPAGFLRCMEASVGHRALEAGSILGYPSSQPSRSACRRLTGGSGLSCMARLTVRPERMCCRSKVTAFFSKTLELLSQEGEAGLFSQGHLPTAAPDVVQV